MEGEPAMIRVVAYYRKSNEDGGESIDQQKDWARPACAAEGVEIVREFIDQAKKGWDTASRTAFHDMLAFCQDQQRRGTPIDAIVCWHANRFSRADSQETNWYIWEFRKAGVNRIFTASHGWRDFRKETDRILFNLEQDTSNHRFVLDLAQACTRGRLDAAREGRPISECPYGYVKEYEEVILRGKKRRRPKRLVPGDPAEVEVVRWLFRSYATGTTSLHQLARELNQRGVRPPKRAALWKAPTIRVILMSEVYIGVPIYARKQFGKFFRVDGGRITPAASRKVVEVNRENWIIGEERHEPLIDEATFRRVQERLTQNRKNTGPDPDEQRPLRGLVVCANCGGKMVGRKKQDRLASGQMTTRRRLLCGTYNATGGSGCSCNTIDEDALIVVLLRKLCEKFLSAAARNALEEEIAVRLTKGSQSRSAEIERLRTELPQLAARLKQAARRVLVEDDALLPALREQLKEMQEEHDRLTARLAALESAPLPADDIRKKAERVASQVRNLIALRRRCNPAALRAVFAEMLSSVELHFEIEIKGGRRFSRLVRGVAHLRPDYILVNCSR
jgi:DNA invertase Pin-like site-specific DNA recombinase